MIRSGRPTFRSPHYSEMLQYLRKEDISCSKLAAFLSFSSAYLKQLIYGDRKMSDAILERINTFLGTDFKHPEPTPEILPHEQLELDRQSLKEKPLFKDESST